MRSIVTYDKSEKTIHCDNPKLIPNFCKKCINDPTKKCKKFYDELLEKDQEGFYQCPYKFGTYYVRNNIYTSLIVKDDSYSKLKRTLEISGQKITDFPQYTRDELFNLISDFEFLIMDNVSLRDCMHDLRNIGSFFNAMSEQVKNKYPDLVENDDVVKALTSLYDLVNYRINILNGVRSTDNKRIKQKIYPLIKKLTIMLSYQARKKDLKFKIDFTQEKFVDLSNNIYLAMFILLENAVKHSISDNEINIDFEETDEFLEVIIKNTGSKIEEDELDKLMIRGYRGKNTTTKGTGIGLSLAKEIFDQHNCPFEIKVTTKNKQESLFIVSIKFKYSER